MTPILRMDKKQKVTVTKAFQRMAVAYHMQPKTLAKLLLKEFTDHPPAEIVLKPSPGAALVELAVQAVASLPVDRPPSHGRQ